MKKQLFCAKRNLLHGSLAFRISWLRELGGSGFRRKFLLALVLPVFVAFFVILLHGQEQGASSQEFNLTMVGDSEIVTPATVHQNNPRFMAVVNAVRQGDAAFTNLEEALAFSPNAYPAPVYAGRGQWHPAVPASLKQLQWMGFNLFGVANNHSMDYGIQGLLDTLQVLKQGDAVYAGIGETLGEARAPGYLSTPHGRVALITCASFFPDDSPAEDARSDMRGRPGINPLHHETVIRVDASRFEALRKIKNDLKLGPGGGESNQSGETGSGLPQTLRISFEGGSPVTFELSDKPGVVTRPDPKELAALTHSIRDARALADYVVASIHAHEGAPGPNPLETPAQFVELYAHAAVDAGADVFVGNGPHVLRGIEIYKGKVILYSLGNFIFENWLMVPEPTEYYEKFGLGPEALPSEVYDARSDHGRRDEPANPLYWQAVVARVTFHDGRPAVVTLTPFTTGFGKKAPDQGYPEVPDLPKATQILEHLQQVSEPYGTKIAISNGVGTITIQK